MKDGGKWSACLAVMMAFMLLSLISACITSNNDGDNDKPESAYGWAWESGSKSAGQAGLYGTIGVASSANAPGAREYPLALNDSSGKAWIFGGYGYDSARNSGYLNDLWKYNPASHEWTWVSGSSSVNQRGSYGARGVAAPTNIPGGRTGSLAWFDANGALWVFGGRGVDASGGTGYLNDLWKLSPTTLEWTWVSGDDAASQPGTYGTQGTASPSNLPGGRYGAVSWLDASGRIWIFGGWGLDSGGMASDLNDLWSFDPTTGEWTWVSGNDLVDQPGVYGTKGTPATDNLPGARDTSVCWLDAAGMLWLFGGGGRDSSGYLGLLNDLWRYNPVTLQWTWISGSNLVNQIGVFGTQGTASSSNIPGGNCGGRSWLDSSGRFWLFGGRGYDAVGTVGALNDLWRFDPTTLEWTWVFGNKTADQPGNFGAKGKRFLTNVPGGREYTASFQDSSGRLWIFGGKGYDSIGSMNYLNDLWEYKRQN